MLLRDLETILQGFRYKSETKFNHIEAITEYCSQTGLEIEVAATLVNSNLKSKIQMDAMDNNMLKEKGSRLPI